ncbi:MAG: hypothetical protein ACAH79_01735 [Thermoleophilia bacterium]
MTTVSPLTAGARRGLPPPCVACVFWQHDRITTDERRKEAWADSFERRHGAFGRTLHDADGFQGMVQYGPAGAFPRALGLPAGPPGRDAALVTCTFLEARDPAGVCERLMLEALADLKARGYPAVEAFGLRYPEEVGEHARFVGHHTLFDRNFLEALGFTPVRSQGQVALMRIGLGGLVPGRGVAERARRAIGRAIPPPGHPAPA